MDGSLTLCPYCSTKKCEHEGNLQHSPRFQHQLRAWSLGDPQIKAWNSFIHVQVSLYFVQDCVRESHGAALFLSILKAMVYLTFLNMKTHPMRSVPDDPRISISNIKCMTWPYLLVPEKTVDRGSFFLMNSMILSSFLTVWAGESGADGNRACLSSASDTGQFNNSDTRWLGV